MRIKGFTLIELQASLLLTLVTLSSLFLFSFYFWQNYHAHSEYLQFQREADRFFDWHHQTMRTVSDVSRDGERIVFTSQNGVKTKWSLTADGPVVHGLKFFSVSVEVTLEYRKNQADWQVVLVIEEPRQKLTRRWEVTYPQVPWANVEVLL